MSVNYLTYKAEPKRSLSSVPRFNEDSRLAQGLVGWWPLNQSFVTPQDFSGRSPFTNPSIQGTPAVVMKPDGNHLDCNNVGHLDLSDTSIITGSQNRTVIMWVAGYSGNEGLFSIDPDANGATGERWTLRHSFGNLRIEIEGSGYTSSLTINISQAVRGDFIACRLDGTTLADHTMFLNGAKEDATGAASVNTNSTYKMKLGSRTTNGTNIYIGHIGDVALYDRALTDQEIEYHLYHRFDLYRQPKFMVPVISIDAPAAAVFGPGRLLSRERNRLVVNQ